MIELTCENCGYDLLEAKGPSMLVVKDGKVITVCDNCFKYVFFEETGFEKIKEE